MSFVGARPGPGFILAAVVLLALALFRSASARPAWRELGPVGIVVACGAAARLAFGVWGPLHVNGHAAEWIRGALDPRWLAGYGPGYPELFSWVARSGAAPDEAIFAANAALSALSPALLYAIARLAGAGRGAALAAAVVLAADAVTVRTAASEGYFTSIIALSLAVQLALVVAVRADARRDPVATGMALAAAGLFAAATARVHPVSYLPLALTPLVALGVTSPMAFGRRAGLAALAAVVIGATVLLTTGETIRAVALGHPLAAHAFTGLSFWHVAVASALLAATWWKRASVLTPWLLVLGIASLALMLATRATFGQHPVWEHCYERLFWPGLLLGAAALRPRGVEGVMAPLAVALGITVAVLVSTQAALRAPTTEQLEYAFLRDVLRSAPPRCAVASVSRVGPRVLELPAYLLPGQDPAEVQLLRVEHASDLREASVAGDCFWYVRSSLCASVEARGLCDAVEREARLERVASRTLPAAPTEFPYDRPEVEVVVFRVLEWGEPAAESASPGGPEAGDAIPGALARVLFDQLTPLRAPDGCRVEGLDTERFQATVRVRTRAGAQAAVDIWSGSKRTCGTRTACRWHMDVPPALAGACPATVSAIADVLGGR